MNEYCVKNKVIIKINNLMDGGLYVVDVCELYELIFLLLKIDLFCIWEFLFFKNEFDLIIMKDVSGVMKLYFNEIFSVFDFSWVFFFKFFVIRRLSNSFLIFM